MRDCTEVFNESGKHIATIGFNESYASRVRVDHREYWQCSDPPARRLEVDCCPRIVGIQALRSACPWRLSFLLPS
jgi:hypothetical protein